MFRLADEIEVRTPGEDATCLDLFVRPRNRLFVYAEGSLEFKNKLAQNIKGMRLPRKYRFGKTGYEFTE